MQAAFLLHIGVKMAKKGDLRQAEQAFLAALRINPGYAQAYSNLGHILNKLGRTTEAEACLRKSIGLNPALPGSYNNLSLILLDTDRLDEAEACLKAAITLDPGSPVLHNNLGLVLEDADRRREAETSYRQAIRLNPGYSDAYYNLANFLKRTQKLAEAESCYRQALKLRPDFRLARFALSTLYLLQGNFENGWESYNELRMKEDAREQGDIPCWQGESLTGRSILLFHEQGLGDSIQFVRYAEKVAAAAAKTVLWIQKPLERLMITSFSGVKIHCGGRPQEDYDFACSLPNLPMLFNTTEKTIPQSSPYLQTAPEIVARWRAVLQKHGDGDLCRVGVVWAGNPKHHNDRNRSIPFAIFSKLLKISGVKWVSLQVGPQAGEALADRRHTILDFTPDLTDFAETAALIENLDLVITVDSAVAHLAGALGKETWLLVPFAPDWRWQLAREDSPWYPAMRLFRQNNAGNWLNVLLRVKRTLKSKLIVKKEV